MKIKSDEKEGEGLQAQRKKKVKRGEEGGERIHVQKKVKKWKKKECEQKEGENKGEERSEYVLYIRKRNRCLLPLQY